MAGSLRSRAAWAALLCLLGMVCGAEGGVGLPLRLKERFAQGTAGEKKPAAGVPKPKKLKLKKDKSYALPQNHKATEAKWASLLPPVDAPKFNKNKRRPGKKNRINTVVKNMSTMALVHTRGNPGKWAQLVDTHEPSAVAGEEGVKVTVGPIIYDDILNDEHYVEFVWLMSEDLKIVLGNEMLHRNETLRDPKKPVSVLFKSGVVWGKRVVPFAACRCESEIHGAWRGHAIDVPPRAPRPELSPEELKKARKASKRRKAQRDTYLENKMGILKDPDALVAKYCPDPRDTEKILPKITQVKKSQEQRRKDRKEKAKRKKEPEVLSKRQTKIRARNAAREAAEAKRDMSD